MADIGAIRDGLKIRMAVIDGLRTGELLKDDVNPPIALVGPPDPIEFDQTMGRGGDKFTFRVYLCVSAASERAAQSAVDVYLAGSGDKSIKQAIEDSTVDVDDAWDTLEVMSAENYGDLVIAGQTYLGVIFVVEVYAKGEVA